MTAAFFCGAALVTVTLSLSVKGFNREISMLLSAAGAVMLLTAAIKEGLPLIEAAASVSKASGMDDEHLSVLFKSTAIALCTQFTSDTCRDAGETSIANKAELCGRVLILLVCLPVFEEVLSLAEAVFSFL